jgi:cell division protein FtsW
MSQFLLTLAAGIALLLIGMVAKSFLLPTAGWIVRAWVWSLTLGLAAEVKGARRVEIASDLWEHRQDGAAAGYAPYQIALHVLLRLLIGMPSDALWRLRQVRFDYVLLGGATALALGGLFVGWEESLTVWVVRATVATAALALMASVSMMREVKALRFRLRGGASWRKERGSLDYTLAVVTAMLLLVGLLAVYTASQPVGYLEFGDANHFVVRHGIYALAGLAALVYFMRLDYRRLRYLAVPMMVLALLGLVAVLVPGLGAERNGVRHSLEIGPVLFHPAEFAKLAVIIYISAWLAARRENINSFTLELVPFALMVSVVGGLVIVEPDMGTAIIIVLTTSTLFFVAGAPLSHMALVMVSGGLVSYAMILAQDYRLDRIGSFIAPEADPQGSGFHISQLIAAIRGGGITGQGWAASHQQPLVPGAHTDGIFAIIGQEAGFVGIAVVMALLFFLVYRGIRVALAASDRLGSLLALGVTCWIAYDAIMNIGGVVRAVPLVGVTLPFISYGGSSLIALLAAVGVLLSISRRGPSRSAEGRAAA